MNYSQVSCIPKWQGGGGGCERVLSGKKKTGTEIGDTTCGESDAVICCSIASGDFSQDFSCMWPYGSHAEEFNKPNEVWAPVCAAFITDIQQIKDNIKKEADAVKGGQNMKSGASSSSWPPESRFFFPPLSRMFVRCKEKLYEVLSSSCKSSS